MAGLTEDQVCLAGYARSVRDVPRAVRTAVFRAYGLADSHADYCASLQGCELDHLVSLSLGGSNDPRNLWPQRYEGATWNAHAKDRLEVRLHALVCSGHMSLEAAQMALSTDWVTAFKLYVGPLP